MSFDPHTPLTELADAIRAGHGSAGSEGRFVLEEARQPVIAPARPLYVEGMVRREFLSPGNFAAHVRPGGVDGDQAAVLGGCGQEAHCAHLRYVFLPLHAAAELADAIRATLGHRDVSTTMIYTHVLNRGGRGVISPADRL